MPCTGSHVVPKCAMFYANPTAHASMSSSSHQKAQLLLFRSRHVRSSSGGFWPLVHTLRSVHCEPRHVPRQHSAPPLSRHPQFWGWGGGPSHMLCPVGMGSTACGCLKINCVYGLMHIEAGMAESSVKPRHVFTHKITTGKCANKMHACMAYAPAPR